MNRIPRKVINLVNFLYNTTPPGGNYKSKILIKGPNEETISHDSLRYKPSTAAPVTTPPTVDNLIDTLIDFMPAAADRLDAKIEFNSKDEIKNIFALTILRDHTLNANQQPATIDLGSVFDNGRRYSARLANK